MNGTTSFRRSRRQSRRFTATSSTIFSDPAVTLRRTWAFIAVNDQPAPAPKEPPRRVSVYFRLAPNVLDDEMAHSAEEDPADRYAGAARLTPGEQFPTYALMQSLPAPLQRTIESAAHRVIATLMLPKIAMRLRRQARHSLARTLEKSGTKLGRPTEESLAALSTLFHKWVNLGFVAEMFRPVAFLRGEVVVYQGEPAMAGLHVVGYGTVEATTDAPHQFRLPAPNARHAGPGSIVGDATLATRQPQRRTIHCTSPECVVWVLSQAGYEQVLAQQDPAVATATVDAATSQRIKGMRDAFQQFLTPGCLNRFPEFAPFPRALVLAAAARAVPKVFPKGATLFRAGDFATHLVLLVSGEVEVEEDPISADADPQNRSASDAGLDDEPRLLRFSSSTKGPHGKSTRRLLGGGAGAGTNRRFQSSAKLQRTPAAAEVAPPARIRRRSNAGVIDGGGGAGKVSKQQHQQPHGLLRRKGRPILSFSSLRREMITPDTTRKKVRVTPIALLGGMSWIQNLRQSQTAVALTSCDVFYLAREHVKAELATCPPAMIPQLYPGDEEASASRYLQYAQRIPLLDVVLEHERLVLTGQGGVSNAAGLLGTGGSGGTGPGSGSPRRGSVTRIQAAADSHVFGTPSGRPRNIRDVYDAEERLKAVVHSIAAAFSLRIYDPGTALCATIDHCDRLIVPITGKAVVLATTSAAKTARVPLPLGQCLGFPVLMPHRWAQRVVVVEQMEALELSYDRYLAILDQHKLARQVRLMSKALLFPDSMSPEAVALAAASVRRAPGPQLYPVTSMESIACGKAPLGVGSGSAAEVVRVTTTDTSSVVCRRPTEQSLKRLAPIPVRQGLPCPVHNAASKARIISRDSTEFPRTTLGVGQPRLQPIVLGKSRPHTFAFGEPLPLAMMMNRSRLPSDRQSSPSVQPEERSTPGGSLRSGGNAAAPEVTASSPSAVRRRGGPTQQSDDLLGATLRAAAGTMRKRPVSFAVREDEE